MTPLVAQEPYCTNNPTLDELIEWNRKHARLMNDRDICAYEIVGCLKFALEDHAENWNRLHREQLQKYLNKFADASRKLNEFETKEEIQTCK